MFGNANWRFGLAAAAILGILGSSQICPAQICEYPDDVVQGGIWIYDEPLLHFTMTVVNLTPYQLTTTDRETTPNAVVASGTNFAYPFEPPLGPLNVDPYRGVIWKSRFSQVTAPNHYYGRMRFHLGNQLWTHTFEVNFENQNGYGTAGRDGTWVALAQTKHEADPAWTNDTWCTSGTFCGGVFATTWMQPLGFINGWSVDMRNIMTLTTDNLVVALYSPDNKNVVLVVRDTGNGSDVYHPVMSEWVDNNETSVPGPCNRK